MCETPRQVQASVALEIGQLLVTREAAKTRLHINSHRILIRSQCGVFLHLPNRCRQTMQRSAQLCVAPSTRHRT